MKTIQLIISQNELDKFKQACKNIDGVEYVSHSENMVTINYEIHANLFYLGMWFSLRTAKQLIKW
jgi:hypothetical protein